MFKCISSSQKKKHQYLSEKSSVESAVNELFEYKNDYYSSFFDSLTNYIGLRQSLNLFLNHSSATNENKRKLATFIYSEKSFESLKTYLKNKLQNYYDKCFDNTSYLNDIDLKFCRDYETILFPEKINKKSDSTKSTCNSQTQQFKISLSKIR